MSDRAYFQGLYDTAKDFTMKAFYAAAVRERNNGVLGPCQHVTRHGVTESSYGSLYYWTICEDCGAKGDQSVSQPW